MKEIECQTKKWGNSLACILPKDIIKERHIKENQKIRIIIEDNSNVLKETFGILKNWKKPTDQIMREIDEDLWGNE